jgi:uncharacterized membrane protein YbhN (UPF0104 family)
VPRPATGGPATGGPATGGPATGGDREPPGPRRTRLRTLVRPLAVLGLLALLAQQLGTDAVLDGLSGISPGTVAAALVLGAVSVVANAARWCLIARRLGLRLPLRTAVADSYQAVFLNATLPAGVLGDVQRALHHGRADGGRAVRAVVLDRVAGHVVLLAVGGIVLLGHPAVAGPVSGWVVTPLVGAAVLAAYPLRRPLGRRLPAALGGTGSAVHPGVVALSALALTGYLATFLLAARVAGVTAPAAELLPLLLLALLAMALPVTVGGWGPREAVAALGFGAAGLGAGQGLAAAVVYGLLGLVAVAPGLLVVLLSAAQRRSAVCGEGRHQARQHRGSLRRGRQRRTAHHSRLRVRPQSAGQQMRSLVGGLVAQWRCDEMRMGVQQQRGLQLPGVHVGELRGLEPGGGAGGQPVVLLGEQRQRKPGEARLLHDVAEDVVATVGVHQHERAQSLAPQRGRDVAHERHEGGRGDAHRARPRGVLVGAGEGDGREQAHGVRVGERAGQGGGDDGVGGQREVRAVLLVAPDRQDGGGGAALAHVERGVGGQEVH